MTTRTTKDWVLESVLWSCSWSSLSQLRTIALYFKFCGNFNGMSLLVLLSQFSVFFYGKKESYSIRHYHSCKMEEFP